MKIAIMGIRGIPANYGGFETFVEELAPRLAEMGHDVTVYGRRGNIDPALDGKLYKGVRIKVLPTIKHKYLDTIFHTFISAVHSVSEKYDAVLMLNAANAPFVPIARLGGAKVVMNVDGIERLRKKWNLAGRLYYRLGERLAAFLPDGIVSDARVIQSYYLRKYGASSAMIPYGAYVGRYDDKEALDRFGLVSGGYVLYVSRLEPENNAHLVIEAFRRVNTDKRLVVVGDAPYSSEYKERLREAASHDDRVVLTGFVFGKGYRELQSHAYCYVQATEVGGTHPALLEAMGFGNCVLANGTPENMEVVEDAAIVYEKNDAADLAEKLQYVMDNPEARKAYSRKATERVATVYSWEKVAGAYERLLKHVIAIRTTSSGERQERLDRYDWNITG